MEVEQLPIKSRVLGIVVFSFFELLICAIIYDLISYIMDLNPDFEPDLLRIYLTRFGVILILFVLMAILGIAMIAQLMGHLGLGRLLDFLDKIVRISIVLFFVVLYTFLNELPSPESTRLPQDFFTKGKVGKT